MQIPVIRAGRFHELLGPYAAAIAAGLVTVVGLVCAVEMVYHLSDSATVTALVLAGREIDVHSAAPWVIVAAVLLAGGLALRWTSRRVGERWGAIQLELQGLRS